MKAERLLQLMHFRFQKNYFKKCAFYVAQNFNYVLNIETRWAFIPATVLFWVCPSRFHNPANEKSFDIIIIDDIFAVEYSANIASGNVLIDSRSFRPLLGVK